MDKRYQVIRDNVGMGNKVALNVHGGALGYGVLAIDTFKDNQVVFLSDKEHKEKTERGEVE